MLFIPEWRMNLQFVDFSKFLQFLSKIKLKEKKRGKESSKEEIDRGKSVHKR